MKSGICIVLDKRMTNWQIGQMKNMELSISKRGKDVKMGEDGIAAERALTKEGKNTSTNLHFFNRKANISNIFHLKTLKFLLRLRLENWKRLTCLQRSSQFLPLLLFAGKQIVANGLDTPFGEEGQ